MYGELLSERLMTFYQRKPLGIMCKRGHGYEKGLYRRGIR